MKLFFHYCTFGFSNCYILGTGPSPEKIPEENIPPQGPPSRGGDIREAVIIDPGYMDEAVITFIESHEYHLRGALITHDHVHHVHGLRTLKRIYDAPIYAVNPVIEEYKTNMVRDGDILTIGPFRIEVISVPGHSSDSAVYRIEHLLFTGDALTAGLVGRTASTYGTAVQMTALRSKIFSLPGNYAILPGHGPPSSLEAERRFNAGIKLFEENKNQRPVFKIDI
ncbi:MAG: MBL fold metallo-hydrolase [Treponema sp.]|jgi:glyoxylase-like metal-dependent hydrolase (beta-lactamase superfamily II)|nr:MBL fold metallo-hydrolase [Treponema sp.]